MRLVDLPGPLPDCLPVGPLLPLTCADEAAGKIGGAVAGGFADQLRDGAVEVMKTTVAWWIKVDPINLEATPVEAIRGFVAPLVVIVAVLGVTWAGIRMALTRKADPLLDVGRGLVAVALAGAVGVKLPAAMLTAGDDFSNWVLDQATAGEAGDRLIALAGLSAISSGGLVIVLALVMMLAGLVQAVLMVFREGAVVILAGVLVLAAAGQFTRATRPWLGKVAGWALALVLYKPAAALVYATSLAMIGSAEDARTTVVGIVMIVLSIVMLPALMKLFSWAYDASSSRSGGGLAAAAGIAAAGVSAAAAHRTSGGAAAAQAGHISADLGPAVTPARAAAPAAGAAPTGAVTAPAAASSASAGGTAGASSPASTGAATATPAAAVVAAPVLVGAQVAGRAASAAAGAMTAPDAQEGNRS